MGTIKNKTLIIGASIKPARYSYKAAEKLLAHNHQIRMIGNKAGELFGQPIVNSCDAYDDVDTVTMYVGAKNQSSYFDYIVSLKPRRVIFNPGTENPELENVLTQNDIAFEQACTLVLLSTGNYD